MIRMTEAEAAKLGIEGAKAKRSKYGNVPSYYDGVRYDSRAESLRAMMLDIDPTVLFWIRQPRFRLGVPENVYVADFLVVRKDGVHVEDVKGRETAKFKRDRKLWQAYGPCDLWIVDNHGWAGEVIEGGKRKVVKP